MNVSISTDSPADPRHALIMSYVGGNTITQDRTRRALAMLSRSCAVARSTLPARRSISCTRPVPSPSPPRSPSISFRDDVLPVPPLPGGLVGTCWTLWEATMMMRPRTLLSGPWQRYREPAVPPGALWLSVDAMPARRWKLSARVVYYPPMPSLLSMHCTSPRDFALLYSEMPNVSYATLDICTKPIVF